MSKTSNTILSKCFPKQEFLNKKRPETVSFYLNETYYIVGGCHGCNRIVVGFTITYAVTIKVVSSNPTHGKVWWVSSTSKTNCHDITEILLKVVLNTVTLVLLFSSALSN